MIDFRIAPGTPWPAGRQTAAVAAATAGFVTAVGAVALSSQRGLTLGVAAIFLGLTVTATRTPTLVAEQTVAGMATAWTTLIGTDHLVVGVVPLVTGVVLSAELLALAGRLAVVVPRPIEPGIRRAVVTAGLACALSTIVIAAHGVVGG